VVEHRDDLSPEATAERLLNLGRDVDAIAVVTVDHPRITEAIERLRANRVPVVAVISDLTARARAGYVGLVLVLALLNRYVLMPRLQKSPNSLHKLRWSAAVELIAGLGGVGLVSAIGILPPT
jgi:hypothetical protein